MMEQANISEDRTRYAKLTREERLHEFKCTIEHPHSMVVCQALHKAIQEPGGASLVFVCDPASVGKTTLKNQVIGAIAAEMLPALQESRELIPILSMSARPPFNGSFSWKDFLQSSLLALEQPLVDRENALGPGDDEGTHI